MGCGVWGVGCGVWGLMGGGWGGCTHELLGRELLEVDVQRLFGRPWGRAVRLGRLAAKPAAALRRWARGCLGVAGGWACRARGCCGGIPTAGLHSGLHSRLHSRPALE